jgi:hypothetical protein
VETVDSNYSDASGEFSLFQKITGPDEVGERLDEGVEILKGMLTGINNLTIITQSGFAGLNCKMDKMLDKQYENIGEIKGLRQDLKDHMDQRSEYIESELAEIKSALRVKGII